MNSINRTRTPQCCGTGDSDFSDKSGFTSDDVISMKYTTFALQFTFFGLKYTRRGVRVAERASLESLCTAMYRGFESRPLRNPEADPASRVHAPGFCRLINSRSNRLNSQKQITLFACTLLGFPPKQIPLVACTLLGFSPKQNTLIAGTLLGLSPKQIPLVAGTLLGFDF